MKKKIALAIVLSLICFFLGWFYWPFLPLAVGYLLIAVLVWLKGYNRWGLDS